MTDDEFKKNLLGSWHTTDYSLEVKSDGSDEKVQIIQMTITGQNGFKEILRLSGDLGRLSIVKKDGSIQNFERDSSFSWIDPNDGKWHRLTLQVENQPNHDHLLRIMVKDAALRAVIPDLLFSRVDLKDQQKGSRQEIS